MKILGTLADVGAFIVLWVALGAMLVLGAILPRLIEEDDPAKYAG